MARANRRRRSAENADWTTVGIGIITVATIIAAATVAAVININREAAGLSDTPNPSDPRLTGITSGIAIVSLWLYLMTVLAGLWALFKESPAEQRTLTKLTAIGLYAQVFAVVIFAFIIIWRISM